MRTAAAAGRHRGKAVQAEPVPWRQAWGRWCYCKPLWANQTPTESPPPPWAVSAQSRGPGGPQPGHSREGTSPPILCLEGEVLPLPTQAASTGSRGKLRHSGPATQKETTGYSAVRAHQPTGGRLGGEQMLYSSQQSSSLRDPQINHEEPTAPTERGKKEGAEEASENVQD